MIEPSGFPGGFFGLVKYLRKLQPYILSCANSSWRTLVYISNAQEYILLLNKSVYLQ
jgi:hypothetical protein